MNEKENKTAYGAENVDVKEMPMPAPDDTNRHISIGLPANYIDTDETRFFVTPECAGILRSHGYRLLMEKHAAVNIGYSDEAYTKHGVEIADRKDVLYTDIVLSVAPLRIDDVKLMKKGAALLCLMKHTLYDEKLIAAINSLKISCVCLDMIYTTDEVAIFAEIIDEIDGKAAIIYAQDDLSFLGTGKGVLLSGVAGVNPCEVLIIGTGHRPEAAASAALAAGAGVTIMDNDVSALHSARKHCGEQVVTTFIHPNVLVNNVRKADVVILDTCTRNFEFPEQLNVILKENVYMLNLNETSPSLIVPRTVAMAISNVLTNFLEEVLLKGGINRMLTITPGLEPGIITYAGHILNKHLAANLGLPCIDFSMLNHAN